eukprot:gnl/TRDRNA2_/TRDRNA2_166032_c2_seq1.p1 gnl/TRDRNA2_/TRDRNA2_166032_c2~~gnl/TRDRNA2_/TRDRNA2_166032_c2_seq1.p1  ORF type:complete len:254 (-),score=14.54 gnl/TRDRNA2_/TRDRNA2_166032_c2_seq1:6-767(-)
MSLKYRGHVLVSRRVVVHNEIHRALPTTQCQVVFAIIDSWLDSLLLKSQHHCLLPLNPARGAAWGTAARGPLLGTAGHYAPWDASSLRADCTSAFMHLKGRHSLLRPSEMLLRDAHVFAPPGRPACFDGGHITWQGCCQSFWDVKDGVASIFFGYAACWDLEFGFEHCCYQTLPPLGLPHTEHSMRPLAPMGRPRPNPVQFGTRLVGGGEQAVCRKELSMLIGKEWYVCRGPGSMVAPEATFETDHMHYVIGS